MTDILLYGTLGALGGIFASCLASGIYAAWHNRRVRSNKVDPIRPFRTTPLGKRPPLTQPKGPRSRHYGNLPPALPTRSAGSYQPPSAILPPPPPPRNDAH